MKKTTTKSAVFTIVLGLVLTACQPNNIESQQISATPNQQRTATRTLTPLPTQTPSPTPTPDWLLPLEELKKIELSFIHPWTGDLANEINQLVDTFNQTNEYSIFVKVVAPGSSQQVFQHSEAALRNDQGPNVVVAPIEELAYWHQFGYLLELDPFIDDVTYGLDRETIQDFFTVFWQQDVIDTIRLGIPISRNANFLVVNTSWAKELEINITSMTPKMFQNQVCAARDDLLYDDDWRNNGMGGWIVRHNDYTILNWLNAFDLAEFPDIDTSYSFDQDATLNAFTYLRDLFDDACAWNARNPTHYEYFANRQALFISADGYDLEFIQKTLDLAENEDQWQVVPYPNLEGEPVLLVHGDSLGILKSMPAEDFASWLFIRWLSAPQQQLQMAQVNPGLPVSQSIQDQISADRSDQWNQVIALLDDAQPAPRTAEWRVARFILQDAAYQIFLANITPEQYPQIISLLDELIVDLSQQPASLAWE